MDGAIKYDAGKPAVVRGVLARFPRALLEIAKVSAIGCEKYDLPPDDINFMNVPDGYGRYTDAAGRHLLAELMDGHWNVEHGGALPSEGRAVLHAAQLAWCALARLEILLRDQGALLAVTRPGNPLEQPATRTSVPTPRSEPQPVPYCDGAEYRYRAFREGD